MAKKKEIADEPLEKQLWKAADKLRKNIDARNMGHLINRRTREFSPEDIKLISDTYHQWRNEGGTYQDVPGFCASVPVSRVAELDYVLTPGRYVGLPEEDDDFNFEDSLQR